MIRSLLFSFVCFSHYECLWFTLQVIINSHHIQWIFPIHAVSIRHVNSRYWSLKEHISNIPSICAGKTSITYSLACLQLQLSWPFMTLFPVSGDTSLIWPGWWLRCFVLQQESFCYSKNTSLISQEYKLMNKWSFLISVAFTIPWVCLVQMHAYAVLCKHAFTYTLLLLCVWCKFPVALPYPLFLSFYSSSSRVRAQLLWFWDSLPGAHPSKRFCCKR